MSTRITVNVNGSRLLKQARENQLANRQTLTQKESDDKFLADVRQFEASAAAQAAARQREGAVPEYRIREQTSAQRGGRDFGLGWIYTTHEDPLEHPWATAQRFRIAVGSGDGTSWDYVDLEQAFPADFGTFTLTTGAGWYKETVSNDGTGDVITWEQYLVTLRNPNFFAIPLGGSPGAGCVLVGAGLLITTRYYQVKRLYGFGNPVITETATDTATQINYAFYVSQNKCRRVTVPPALNTLLNEAVTANTYVYFSGPAAGRINEYAADFGLFYGTPGVWDFIQDDFNIDHFENMDPLVSSVTNRITLTAPDYDTGAIVDGVFTGSTFWFNAEAVRQNPFGQNFPGGPAVNLPAPTLPPGQQYNENVFRVELPSYSYLKPEWRQQSPYYTYSTLKPLLDALPANPEFWIQTKDNIPNPPGISKNPIGLPEWLPEGTYKVAAKLRLSANRILPPALFNATDTVHPLISPQPVPYRHVDSNNFRNTDFSQVSNRFTYPNAPYSYYGWQTLLWSDWNAGRQNARLSALGFNASTLR